MADDGENFIISAVFEKILKSLVPVVDSLPNIDQRISLLEMILSFNVERLSQLREQQVNSNATTRAKTAIDEIPISAAVEVSSSQSLGLQTADADKNSFRIGIKASQIRDRDRKQSVNKTRVIIDIIIVLGALYPDGIFASDILNELQQLDFKIREDSIPARMHKLRNTNLPDCDGPTFQLKDNNDKGRYRISTFGIAEAEKIISRRRWNVQLP